MNKQAGFRRVLRVVALDNGGSGIRVCEVGDGHTDEMMVFENNIVSIEESDFRKKDIEDPRMLCRILKAPCEEYKKILAQGMTGQAYNNRMLAVSSQKAKTSSDNYYLQMLFAIARDALRGWVKSGGYSQFTIGSEHFNAEVDFCYVITVCIPIVEFMGVKDCASKLKDKISGEYEVEFPLMENCPRIRFTVKKEWIGVVPEGGVAVAELRGQLSSDDYSIVVDMGHVSTDIALFKGLSVCGRVVSSQFAGSTLIANVRNALADEGYILSEGQIAKVIKTGAVKSGKKEVDVSDMIREHERNFVANYLTKEIIQVLNMNAVNAKQVQNVIPIGAPMNKPMGSDIIKEIVRECGFEDAEVKLLACDLRYVNVEQAAKFARVLAKKASKDTKLLHA